MPETQDESPPEPPIELQWTPIATTHIEPERGKGFPRRSSISLFAAYPPDDSASPCGTRQVYLRVSVSFVPEIFFEPEPEPEGPAASGEGRPLNPPSPTSEERLTPEPEDEVPSPAPSSLLGFLDAISATRSCADQAIVGELVGAGLPLLGSVLDLVVRPVPVPTAEMSLPPPIIVDVSPKQRTLVQTGNLGREAIDGMSESVAIGKSNTQLHESSRVETTRTESGGNVWGRIPIPFVGLLGASGGVKTSTTTVDATTDSQQVVDTTTRQAAQERRELISAYTNVENVLTLLSSRHRGSQHVQFKLRPAPIRVLAESEDDARAWYARWLERESAGLEGTQDFIAIVDVPRGLDREISVELRLHTVAALLPSLPDRVSVARALSDADLLRYLERKFPRGTPLEQLDVDLGSEVHGEMSRPVVHGWEISTATTSRVDRPVTTSRYHGITIHFSTDRHVRLLARGVGSGTLGRTSYVQERLVPYKDIAEVELDYAFDQWTAQLEEGTRQALFMVRPTTLAVDLIPRDRCPTGRVVVNDAGEPFTVTCATSPSEPEVAAAPGALGSRAQGLRVSELPRAVRFDLWSRNADVLLDGGISGRSRRRPFALDEDGVWSFVVNALAGLPERHPANVELTEHDTSAGPRLRALGARRLRDLAALIRRRTTAHDDRELLSGALRRAVARVAGGG